MGTFRSLSTTVTNFTSSIIIDIIIIIIISTKNAIRTYYIKIKAKTDDTKQSDSCRLCGDRDEMVNHIISEGKKKKIDTTEKQSQARLCGKGDSWEIVPKMKIWLYSQMVYAEIRIRRRDWEP